MNLTLRCEAEVVRLHRWFQSWFNGEVADTQDQFSILDISLDTEFEIIGPHGTVTQRRELIGALRGGYGSDRDDPMEIRIKNVRARLTSGEFVIVTYEEWQSRGSSERGRQSTALLRLTSDHSIRWIHVHETWLPLEVGD